MPLSSGFRRALTSESRFLQITEEGGRIIIQPPSISYCPVERADYSAYSKAMDSFGRMSITLLTVYRVPFRAQT